MTKTPATKKTTAPHPCACSEFDFDVWIDDSNGTQSDGYDTGCSEVTKRTFAMGHDAKLVGFLVRAELAGVEIRRTMGGVAICYSGAVQAAEAISDALAVKTLIQLNIAEKKAEKKAAKAPKADRDLAKAKEILEEIKIEGPIVRDPAPEPCRGKVGRWTYDGVELADGSFRFSRITGGVKTAEAGSWTRV